MELMPNGLCLARLFIRSCDCARLRFHEKTDHFLEHSMTGLPERN